MDPDYDLILFDPSQGIAFKYGMTYWDQKLPFGRAYCGKDESDAAGDLAFDLLDSMAIIFIPLDGSPPRRIAATFEQMMLNSALEFYG
jgi:hypothetical protein